jgi:hypothetical protein
LQARQAISARPRAGGISAGGRRKLVGLKPNGGHFHAARKSLRKPGYIAEGNDLIAAITAGLEAAVRGATASAAGGTVGNEKLGHGHK